mgnify:FL=1
MCIKKSKREVLMQNNNISKSFIFRGIMICLIFLPILSGWYISCSLNLTWDPTNYSSYKNLDVIFSIPLKLASLCVAVLGIYTIWFRINQTSLQILHTENQVRAAEIRHETEMMMSEINYTCEKVDKLIDELETTPQCIINMQLKKDRNIKSWKHDFNEKHVVYELGQGETIIAPWGVSMLNLKTFINGVVGCDIRMEYDNNYPAHSKIGHSNIAEQLKILVIYCQKLAETDQASHNIINNKLSRYFEIIHLLNKVELFENHLTEVFSLLQSLSFNSRHTNLDLGSKFFDELKEFDLIDKKLTKYNVSDIKFVKQKINSGYYVKHVVVIGNRTLERDRGVWKICDE